MINLLDKFLFDNYPGAQQYITWSTMNRLYGWSGIYNSVLFQFKHHDSI